MSCQRSSPSSSSSAAAAAAASPRQSKNINQKQSWDDCGGPQQPAPAPGTTPPSINLYNPGCHELSRTPSTSYRSQRHPLPQIPPKSPTRKFNKPVNASCYYDANSIRNNSTTSSSSQGSRSMTNFHHGSNSPKYDSAPRSPKIMTTYDGDDGKIVQNHCQTDDDDDDCDCDDDKDNDDLLNEISTSAGSSTTSFYQTPTSGSHSPKAFGFYNDSGRNQSPRRSPKSPRKFVFDAISPSYDQTGKKFEYYEPVSPDDDQVEVELRPPPSRMNQQSNLYNTSVTGQQINSGGGGSMHNQGRRNSKNFKSRPLIPNCNTTPPPAVQLNQLDDRIELNQQNVRQQSGNLLEEFAMGSRNIFLKRDSCMTESTQISGDSCETNITAMTSLSSDEPKSGGGASTTNLDCIGGGGGSSNNVAETILMTGGGGGMNVIDRKLNPRNRRHAINITSNPGYQALHSSHSTLDRTCSDSVVSLRCRKSTSDLTKMEGNITDGCSAPVLTPKPRRRGSSKGGLAYLASRRSSRDSIKSACSNTSIFSNEDVGPLAFQASTRGRQRRTSNFLELPIPDHVRPRVCSLPDRPYNPRISDDLYRLRHFSISKGNVVNCGDSIISRRSRSNTSVNSTTSRASERSPFDGSCCGGGYANVDSMPPSPTDSEEPPPPPRYRIVMLGDASVGKTALVSQFMTSEYMHTYDASLDDEFGEKTVSILLDDEESELVFIDHPSVEMSVENSLSTYEPHACVIVYSVVDKNSFKIAEDIINYLWKENITKEKAVILVGNKADLARSRTIPTADGKNLAGTRDVKFIETSSGIQHNVDELLVGALKQIRLKEKRDKKKITKMKTSRTHISLHLAKEILQKICLTDITKSKSCENLHVL